MKSTIGNERRNFLKTTILSTGSIVLAIPHANAVQRAVGSAELSCREAGDCLQKGDLDGAVGWNWGGKDRCDATDPKCGPDGVLKDTAPSGEAIPDLVGGDGQSLKITNVIDIEILIGKTERNFLRIGLYGDLCPSSVSQMMDFLGDTKGSGILNTSKLMLEDGIGLITAPVALNNGGVLNYITPQSRLDFGVPSQAFAFARAKNRNKAGDNFVPQPRLSGLTDSISRETSSRAHNVAGLISIPKKGLGYGSIGLGNENEDEAFASAFEITAAGVPSMDNEGRKVIGQLIDGSSMTLLARLASLPTKKGLKGVIPGQNTGPPLLKVSVLSTSVISLQD